MNPAGRVRSNMVGNIDALRQNASRGGVPGDRRGPLCPLEPGEPQSRELGAPRGRPLIRAIKPSGPHAVAEPKFLLPVVVLPEPLLGRTSWPS
jgi:hypothetical protein